MAGTTFAQDILKASETLPLRTAGGLVRIPPVLIPGIVAADALDANDAMGIAFAVPVPPAGAIVGAFFHDLDDEGSNKTLHLYHGMPSSIASDAAYAPTDADNLIYAGRIRFDGFSDLTNNQVGVANSADLPLWYFAPDGMLWMQVQTAGTDNIAAGSMPRLSFLIHQYAA